jgi:hypothetical protein
MSITYGRHVAPFITGFSKKMASMLPGIGAYTPAITSATLDFTRALMPAVMSPQLLRAIQTHELLTFPVWASAVIKILIRITEQPPFP